MSALFLLARKLVRAVNLLKTEEALSFTPGVYVSNSFSSFGVNEVPPRNLAIVPFRFPIMALTWLPSSDPTPRFFDRNWLKEP